jgi:membrane protein implicated in regulation of membrane protease activity
MKSLFTGKVWIILLVFAALIGLIVLASGLNDMKFDAPNMVKLDNFFRLRDSSLPEDTDHNPWLRYLVIGMFIVLFLVMLGPVRPQTSKSLLMQLVRLFAFTVIAMVIMSRFARNNPMFSEEGQADAGTGEIGTQLPSLTPPVVTPQWEFWITALVSVVIGVIAIVIFNRYVDRWFQPKTNLEEIADIASLRVG